MEVVTHIKCYYKDLICLYNHHDTLIRIYHIILGIERQFYFQMIKLI